MLYKYAVLFLLITLSAGVAKAESSGDEPWREEMKKLIYSSRYFGPNALPIPTMHSGSVSNRWEVKYGANTIVTPEIKQKTGTVDYTFHW